MKMTFRWYGAHTDPVPLHYIKQIPHMSGVVSSLGDVPVGQAWPREAIAALKREVNDAGLALEVIESVNIHEDIKLGSGRRDEYIDNYRTTIARLGQAGIRVICYNFMPVFDWLRTELYHPCGDGANTMYYDQAVIDGITDPQMFADHIQKEGAYSLAGWEPERMQHIRDLIGRYSGISHEALFGNLKYFLDAVIPVCREYDVALAIHPDDPPWDIFGLPRICTCEEHIARILSLNDSPYNGLTLCSGALGADPRNDIPAMVRRFGGMGRIHFAHVRNIRFTAPGKFEECSHYSDDGDLPIYEIMRAYHDVGFTGYIRPDHGRMIWGEQGRAGYGLYDRALGAAYLNGLWEALEKSC